MPISVSVLHVLFTSNVKKIISERDIYFTYGMPDMLSGKGFTVFVIILKVSHLYKKIIYTHSAN